MVTQDPDHLNEIANRFARGAALMVLALGVLALAGWMFDLPRLASVEPSWVSMKANTALGLILSGIALWLLGAKGAVREAFIARIIVQLCASLLLVLSLLTLAQNLFDWNLGIDEWLVRDTGTVATPFPGRMALTTAVAFLFTGVGLLVLTLPTRTRLRAVAVGTCGILIFALGLAAMAGYIGDISTGHEWWGWTGMAFPTAVGFLLVGSLITRFGLQEGSFAWSRENAINLGFGFGLLLLSLVVIVSLRNTTSLVRSSHQVQHTHEVIAGFDQVLLALRTAESARRGYVITGTQEHLASYGAGLRNLELDLQKVHELTRDNPLQQQRLADLDRLIDRRVILMRRSMEALSIDPTDISTQRRLTLEGRGLMDEIQAAVAELVRGEERLLKRRSEAEQASARRTNSVVVLGGAVAFGFVALAAVLINRDIQRRKVVETRLREEESRKHAILESALDCIISMDREGCVMDWNPAAERTFGYSRRQVVGQPLADFIVPPRLREAHWRGLRRFLETGHGPVLGKRVEMSAVRADGTEFPVELAISVAQLGTQFFTAYLRDITERKRAEAALRASEEQYRLLFNSIDEGFCIVEVLFDERGKPRDYRFLEINPAFEEQTGLRGALGRQIRELVPQIEEHWIQTYAQVASTGASVRFENRAAAMDNRWFNVFAFRVGEPEARHVAILFTDISEKKRSEEALRRSEEQLRLISDATPALISYIDAGLNYRFVNRQYEVWFGHRRQEVLGRSMEEVLGQAAMARLRPHVERALAGESVHFESELSYRDGGTRWIDAFYMPHRDDKGVVLGFYVLVVDITERRRAEETRQRLAAIVESSDDAIYGKTLEGVITSWNRGAERIFGYTAQEIVSQPVSMLIPPERANELPQILEQLRRGEAVEHYETLRQRKDGMVIHVSLTISPIKNPEGRVIGASSVARDVTEQKVQEEIQHQNLALAEEMRRVQEANRLKSEFLAGMSHELRTPLNGIIGFGEFLVDEKPGPLNRRQREYLNDILVSAQHLLHLINDILDLAKVESGKMELRPEPFLVNKAIEEVCAVINPMAEKKHIAVHADSRMQPPQVTLDPQKFKQVLFNLLSNAVKFTDEGGHVDVLARGDGDGRLCLSVKDTGIGIKPEDLPRLFKEFQQLDSGRRRAQHGTGLGLALTKRIVELQHGEITVASEPGRGSTFRVVLPVNLPDGKAMRGKTALHPHHIEPW